MISTRKFTFCVIVVLSIALVTTSLQLSRNQEIHEVINSKEKHSYYGRYSRSHRTKQYIQKVTQDNTKFIDQFNIKNKYAFKSKKQGNYFSLGVNHFVEFSLEEFDHLFKGVISKKKRNQHEQTINSHNEEQHDYQDNNARILLSNYAEQQMQAHFQEIELHQAQQKKIQSNYQHDARSYLHLGYQNPYELDDNRVHAFYGNTNSNDNFGWDWESMDPEYYKEPSANYNSHWQHDHWGFTHDHNKDHDDSWYDHIWQNPPKQQFFDNWFNDWFGEEQKHKKDDDDWWNTPSTPNKPNGPVSPNKPSGPVSPYKPGDNAKPSNMKTSKKKLDPYSENEVQVNWPQRGGTTHIKDQGQCGSCWTFAALGTVQSFFVIQGKGILDLSQQMLVDCQKKSNGCNGGYVSYAFDYIIKNGMVTQDKYPYRGLDQRCAHQKGNYKIAKYQRISGTKKIQSALRKGPVMALIAASGKQIMAYKKGIYDKCYTTQVDHAIVIVGFTSDYWIIRNSWGTKWGQEGHMRLKRSQNNNNACGIQKQTYYITS